MKIAALTLALLAGSAAAAPAPRTPEQQQVLVDLAYSLGQAHALHRICAGPADNTWRARMERMLEVEAPGEAQKTRLTDSFNAGFGSRPAQAKDCKVAAAAESAIARRGAALSRRLAPGAP